jgi:hypothetical protein
MSRKLRIAPLHRVIGPPPKALPPVPLKPVKKKKGEESDDEDDDDEAADGGADGGSGSEDEEGRKKKKGKAKAMEWLMMEDAGF